MAHNRALRPYYSIHSMMLIKYSLALLVLLKVKTKSVEGSIIFIDENPSPDATNGAAGGLCCT